VYDEEQVAVFKFYDRRKKKNVLIFACVDLYCIYQSGTAGFAAWLRLAGHARRAWRAGVVSFP
jgi:hypothetical protein